METNFREISKMVCYLEKDFIEQITEDIRIRANFKEAFSKVRGYSFSARINF